MTVYSSAVTFVVYCSHGDEELLQGSLTFQLRFLRHPAIQECKNFEKALKGHNSKNGLGRRQNRFQAFVILFIDILVFKEFCYFYLSSYSLDKPPSKLLLSHQTSTCVTNLARAPGSSDPEACQLSLAGNVWEVFLMIQRAYFPIIRKFRVTSPCGDKRTGLPCQGQQSLAWFGCKTLATYCLKL